MDNWIRYEDETPTDEDNGTDYIVHLVTGRIMIGRWHTDDFWDVGYYTNRLSGVTHYMELPNAPR